MLRFRKRTLKLILFILVLLGIILAEQLSGTSTNKQEQDQVIESAWEQYQQSVEIRAYNGGSGSHNQLQKEWQLLLFCTGVVITNTQYDPNWISEDKKTINGFPGVQLTKFPPHVPALCEMAFALERGEGVQKNTLLGYEFLKLSAELGASKCQGEYGMRLALGIRPDLNGRSPVGKIVEIDIQQALLMYFLGASGNDSLSSLALGFRHMEGIAVPQSCHSAVSYLDPAAAKVIDLAARPEGLPRFEKPRLSYRAQNDFRSSRDAEVFQFYQNAADLGNTQHQNFVGELYFAGSFGNKDLSTAYSYFLKAARGGDSDAMANLGHMYANGLGVVPANDSALYWFKKAADANNADGHYGLGYMYLNGYGVPQNYTMALKSFRRAAEGKHVDAYYHLGVMFTKGWGMKTPSDAQALRYFTLASQNGHTTATYNAALMHASGRGTTPNCDVALKSFRMIIHKGPWMELFETAYEKFLNGKYDEALLMYLRGSEMGLELAISNAAWMLERMLGVQSSPQATALMIKLNRRAVELGNVQGLLSMGDAFFYGIGVQQDMKQAAHLYRQASEQKSITALFNLGFMHHFGAGLPMDTHLAKRYYDEAIREEKKARLPVVPFLALIHAQNWWKDTKEILPDNVRAYVETVALKVTQMAVPQPGTQIMHSKPFRNGVTSIVNLSWIESLMTWAINRLEQILYSQNASEESQAETEEGESSASSTDAFESVIIVILVLVLLGILQRRRALRNQTLNVDDDVSQRPQNQNNNNDINNQQQEQSTQGQQQVQQQESSSQQTSSSSNQHQQNQLQQELQQT